MSKIKCKNPNCGFIFSDSSESEVEKYRFYSFKYWDYDRIRSEMLITSTREKFIPIGKMKNFIEMIETLIRIIDVCPICEIAQLGEND